MRTEQKKVIGRGGKTAQGMVLAGIAVLLLFFSKAVAQSQQNGIQICLNTLIPSLFCFMVFSDFAVQTGLLQGILKPVGFLARHIWKIEDSFTDLLVFSMIGGYPVGAKLLADQVRRGTISPEEGERMLCFCVNAGPAFVIGSVAVPMFGNAMVGWVIFASHFLSCLLCGLLCGIGRKAPPKGNRRPSGSVPLSVQMVRSVRSASGALAGACGFVLLFCGGFALLDGFGLRTAIVDLLQPVMSEQAAFSLVTGLLEVTSGTVLLNGMATPAGAALAAGITGFGGFCVHAQVAALLSGTGIRMRRFYRTRLLYALCSAGLTFIGAQWIPLSQSVFQTGDQPAAAAWSVSPVASFCLIILCIMLLLSGEKSDTIRIGKKPKRLEE